jgi:site-specific recombinase XerD
MDPPWERFPLVAQEPPARVWLTIQADLGLAANTVVAYGRALEDYLRFLAARQVRPAEASRSDVAGWVRELRTRPGRRPPAGDSTILREGLSHATLQQRLVALRLFYDYLLEEGERADNPVGRGRYTPGGISRAGGRGLLPRHQPLPWIPSDDQWQSLLRAARSEPLRNRLMLALAYDAALRREELCSLEVGDLDPARRLLRIRAETTKGRRDRVIPYSEPTGQLYAAYLAERRALSRERGPLFRSHSDRNRAQPLSIWTWSKVVTALARRAEVPRFTTHTPRHLRLTDLARAGWDVYALATFAGHRSIQTTLQYVHLSGRDLAAKLARGMAEIHAWRSRQLGELLP